VTSIWVRSVSCVLASWARGGVHLGLGHVLGGDGIVEVPLRDGSFLDQWAQTVHVPLGLRQLRLVLRPLGASPLGLHLLPGVHEIGLGLAEGGPGCLHRCLVRASVEFEEDLILLDGTAVLEEDLLERRLDPSGNVYRAVGHGLGDVLGIDGHGPPDDLGHHDRRWGGACPC
jgi:hypothetical protein